MGSSRRAASGRTRRAQKKLPVSRPRKSGKGTGSFVFQDTRLVLSCELASWPLRKASVEALLKLWLRRLGMPKAGISLLICGTRRSRVLNRGYRKKDKATDILSFPSLTGKARRGFRGWLGDLALNWPYVRQKGLRFTSSADAEAAFLLSHGLLHLTGLHHDNPSQEKRMQAAQRALLAAPGLARLKLTSRRGRL